MRQQVRRHEGAQLQAVQGSGGAEHTPEVATGRTGFRERRYEGWITKNVVTALVSRLLMRSIGEKGLTEASADGASALRCECRADGEVELR